MNILLDMFVTFAKVGVMTFGGGYAMLPILQREVVENKGWATEEELTDYYAIGQCTPGIIAVNTATFIGYKHAGVIGGVAATLGIVFPSLVIITLLAGVISTFSHVVWLQNAFAGIRVVKLIKKAVLEWRAALIYAAILVAACLTDVSPVIFVPIAALVGIILKSLEAKRA